MSTYPVIRTREQAYKLFKRNPDAMRGHGLYGHYNDGLRGLHRPGREEAMRLGAWQAGYDLTHPGYAAKSDSAMQRAINRYFRASVDKGFQGSIPRYESDEAWEAYEAIDTELLRALELLEATIERRVRSAKGLG